MSTTQAADQSLVAVRQKPGNKAAIIFIHGFSGGIGGTWQKFPELLAKHPALDHWDIWLLGYSSHLTVDVLGFWAADPDIHKLGDRVVTDTTQGRLAGYPAVAFIAHSMGGLVTQRALLNSPKLAAKTSHVLLYGTPSAGLKKASWVSRLKPQLRDMAAGSPFIEALRGGWTASFDSPPDKTMPFRFVAAAGERDEFVPASSALGPFRDQAYPERVAVVPGNHIEMVKPTHAGAACVQLAVNTLCGGNAAAGPLNSAAVAVELSDFKAAIAKLEPNLAQLDASAKVQLAIALDRVGRREDAIRLLRDSGQAATDTDAMGTLAGRLKRRWLTDRIAADGEEALALYAKALGLARAAGDPAQAYYLGINVAFLELALRDDLPQARQTARQVLEDCAAAGRGGDKAQDKRWRLATEAEALLMTATDTQEEEQALARYRAALCSGTPETWQVTSMHQQARHLAHLLGEDRLVERVDAVFQAPC